MDLKDKIYELFQEDSFELATDGDIALIAYTAGFYKGKQEMYNEKQIVDYASFCVRCDRENLPLLNFNDFLKL